MINEYIIINTEKVLYHKFVQLIKVVPGSIPLCRKMLSVFSLLLESGIVQVKMPEKDASWLERR